MKNIFKYLLPTFLFKWDGDIEIEPELNDIKSYCETNSELSFLLLNFKKMVKALNDVDMDAEENNAKDMINRKGTK
jgi:hypothetical protein